MPRNLVHRYKQRQENFVVNQSSCQSEEFSLDLHSTVIEILFISFIMKGTEKLPPQETSFITPTLCGTDICSLVTVEKLRAQRKEPLRKPLPHTSSLSSTLHLTFQLESLNFHQAHNIHMVAGWIPCGRTTTSY